MRNYDDTDRPRELLMEKGVRALSDKQLLMVLIGSGIKGKSVSVLADEILSLFDKNGGIPDLEKFRNIRGLGDAKCALMVAAFEFVRRILFPMKWKVLTPQDVLPAIERFANRKKEYFLCVSLNGAHEIVHVHVVTIGLVNKTIVHPREVFAKAITKRAAAVIVAHNHPSGNVVPSNEDRQVTTRLVKAGHTLGISVLDHIVFSGDNYYSFLENSDMCTGS